MTGAHLDLWMVRRICDVVAEAFGVESGDVLAPTRRARPVARARPAAMYLAHVQCGVSMAEVGRLFGRNVSTVMHACAVMEDLRDDPAFDALLDRLAPTLPRPLGGASARGEAA